MLICSNCATEVVSQYGSSDIVCQECGQVIAEGELQINEFPRTDQNTKQCLNAARPFHLRHHKTKRISDGMNACYQLAQSVCYAMGFSSLYENVKQMITKVLKHEHFSHRRIESKKTITACCVYLVFRGRNHAITFDDLQKHCKDTPKNYEHWKSQIVQHFPELIELNVKTSIIELATRIVGTLKFDKTVLNKVLEIINLADKIWLTEGHKPELIVLASLYLAWVAEAPSGRMKVKVTKFCEMHKIAEKTPMIAKNVTFLLQALKQLAEQLPWYESDDVRAKETQGIRVILHLEDILSFQKLLISEASKKLRDPDSTEPPRFGGKRPRADDSWAYEIRKKLKPGRRGPPKHDQDIEIPEGLDLMREELDEHDLNEEQLREHIRSPEEFSLSLDIRDLVDVNVEPN